LTYSTTRFQQWGLEAGSKIFFVFEIKKPGTGPHEISFAGAPLVGPTSDWDAINAIGKMPFRYDC
jgi:hypothetical protein